ncbi:hypothetical protein [Fibrella aquatica]|uniref:hypothetical protein n=1 Tax=Fibrella aquatica TaxID=3242487 RepID=UPI00351FAF0B
MLEDKKELSRILSTVIELFRVDNDSEIADLLRFSEINSEQTDYENWGEGIAYYSVYVITSVDRFVKLRERQTEVQAKIKEKIEIVLYPFRNTQLAGVYIIPKSIPKIDWGKISDKFTKDQLIAEVKYLKDTMVSVSTGGQRIQDVNSEFQKRYILVDKSLKQLSIENPNTFNDLWKWYERWRSGEMPQYKDRRLFIGEMYSGLLGILQETEQSEILNISVNMTGWERVERSISEVKNQLKSASNEEQFQAIGLLCRETIISIAQAIYDNEKYPTLDGVKASKTDAKRMLEAYIAIKLAGGANESLRKYARASNDLANELTHKRTASKKDASLCYSATISLINLIGILEDKH